MPKLISEIKQAILAKEKMGEKNKTEKPKVEKEIFEFAAEKLEYDEKIKKEKDEKKEKELIKAHDQVVLKHKNAKLKLELIEKAETSLLETLKELQDELEKAEEGLENYGKARKQGIAMLNREGKILKGHCEEALRCSQDAEAGSAEAEKAAKEGRENDAQGARNNANNSVMATINAATKAKEVIEDITDKMTKTQRNLKAKDFDIADKEILVHNNLTKKVQDDFKALELMAFKCPGYVKNAEDAAAEATEFANATSVGVELYKGIVAKALENGTTKIEKIKSAMGAKWGGYITNKGELFTRLLKELGEKPTDQSTRSMCEKAVEQGQTYLATTLENVNHLIDDLVIGAQKAMRRVPDQYQRALKGDIDRVRMMSIQMTNYKKKVESDYNTTDAEFQKLVEAVG